jgi:hypothetical protein
MFVCVFDGRCVGEGILGWLFWKRNEVRPVTRLKPVLKDGPCRLVKSVGKIFFLNNPDAFNSRRRGSGEVWYRVFSTTMAFVVLSRDSKEEEGKERRRVV